MESGIKKYSIKHFYYKIKNLTLQKLHPDWPWWPKDAVILCSRLIKKSDILLEFGAGRSTFWMAKRCAGVRSIEHHEGWYNIVKKQVSDANLDNSVQLVYAPITEPDDIESQEYLLAAKAMNKASVDIVIIDGKFRAQAAHLSIPLLRSGGFMIIDDAHRYLPEKDSEDIFPEAKHQDIWKEIAIQTESWRSVWISDGVHATYFLIKP